MTSAVTEVRTKTWHKMEQFSVATTGVHSTLSDVYKSFITQRIYSNSLFRAGKAKMPLYRFYYYAPARGTELSLLITSLHAALARYRLSIEITTWPCRSARGTSLIQVLLVPARGQWPH